jgi:hypothetical protein
VNSPGLQNPNALILTADSEDDCPADRAPEWANVVAGLSLPFPVGIVLFYREFETLAIASAQHLAGKPLRSIGGQTIAAMSTPSSVPDDPEAPRDAKGWVSKELLGGRPYKPTVHQLGLVSVATNTHSHHLWPVLSWTCW